jgi:hypothetical protein
MVDGLHILIQKRKKNPLAMALSGAESGSRGKGSGGYLSNVQHKSIWNCPNESAVHKQSVLAKKFKHETKI